MLITKAGICNAYKFEPNNSPILGHLSGEKQLYGIVKTYDSLYTLAPYTQEEKDKFMTAGMFRMEKTHILESQYYKEVLRFEVDGKSYVGWGTCGERHVMLEEPPPLMHCEACLEIFYSDNDQARFCPDCYEMMRP